MLEGIFHQLCHNTLIIIQRRAGPAASRSLGVIFFTLLGMNHLHAATLESRPVNFELFRYIAMNRLRMAGLLNPPDNNVMSLDHRVSLMLASRLQPDHIPCARSHRRVTNVLQLRANNGLWEFFHSLRASLSDEVVDLLDRMLVYREDGRISIDGKAANRSCTLSFLPSTGPSPAAVPGAAHSRMFTCVTEVVEHPWIARPLPPREEYVADMSRRALQGGRLRDILFELPAGRLEDPAFIMSIRKCSPADLLERCHLCASLNHRLIFFSFGTLLAHNS